MIEFSSSFKFNEIHTVDSLFEIPGSPNFGVETVEKFGEIGNNREIFCYANRKVVNFEREYRSSSPGTKIHVMA